MVRAMQQANDKCKQASKQQQQQQCRWLGDGDADTTSFEMLSLLQNTGCVSPCFEIERTHAYKSKAFGCHDCVYLLCVLCLK